MKMILTFEEFKKHIDAMIDAAAFQDGIGDLVRAYNTKQNDQVSLLLPSLITNVVELLEHIMGDKYEWISYWVWELDFGKEYRAGCVTDKNGQDIKLESVHDLYRFLSQEDSQTSQSKAGEQYGGS